MIIAIDGYSATGKSTLAKLLAKKLNFIHLNSGLIFRAISHKLISNGIKKDNFLNRINEVEQLTKKFNIQVPKLEENILELKKPEISELGAQIAKLEFVREKVLNILKEFAKKSDLVVDGRDIGTIVFPNADIKFFFKADTEIRVRRLGKERNSKDFKGMRTEIEMRDKEDVSRAISPLKRADDAIYIDTSHISVQQTLETLERYINEL